MGAKKTEMSEDKSRNSQSGGGASLFPWKLHDMLSTCENEGLDSIVSWISEGKAFKVHNISSFVKDVLPRFVKQSRYKSYQRQLNLWGFHRIVKGENKGAYFHKHFLKGRYDLCHLLSRQGAKREREGLSPDVPDGEMSIANPTSNTSIPKSKSTEVRKKRKKIVIKKIKIQKAEKAAVGKPSAEVAIPMVLDDLLKERQLVQPQASKPATFEGCQFFLLDIAKGDDLLGGLTKSSNPQGKGATTDPTCPIEEMDLTTRSVFSSTSKRPIHLIPQSNMAISA